MAADLPVTVEPPVRIELTTARLQGECSTTELRRPAGTEFIGWLSWAPAARRRKVGGLLSVKDDLLEDFPNVYPGLTRPEIERLLTLLDQSASADGRLGLSIATALEPSAPDIARRIKAYKQSDDIDEYVRMLRGAVVLLLQKWAPDEQPPTPGSISDSIETIEGED